MSFFGSIAASVREVNRKYAKPEIETTLFVKICLLALRLYLIIMIGLMVYALVRQVRSGSEPQEKTGPAPAAIQPAESKAR
jgi:hypothetical protein